MKLDRAKSSESENEGESEKESEKGLKLNDTIGHHLAAPLRALFSPPTVEHTHPRRPILRAGCCFSALSSTDEIRTASLGLHPLG